MRFKERWGNGCLITNRSWKSNSLNEKMKKIGFILLIAFVYTTCCKQARSNIELMELEKCKVAYTFLLNELKNKDHTLIASEKNENLDTIINAISENRMNLEVEDYFNLEKHTDLCYYSKSTKRLVVVISVLKGDENKYYVSYYIGPEGGASKEIEIVKRKGRWTVTNDDGRCIVK